MNSASKYYATSIIYIYIYIQKGICVENECCCPRTVNISNVSFTSKISIPPEPVFKNMGQQMSGPDSSIGQSIRHESEGWGFESPSGRDIFCLKNFYTFTRTPVRVSKMNAVACAQLTFQMLALLKYIYIYIYKKGFGLGFGEWSVNNHKITRIFLGYWFVPSEINLNIPDPITMTSLERHGASNYRQLDY